MTHIRTIALSLVCLLLTSAAVAAAPSKARPKPKARKCPADKVVIGGQDIAKILTMLGAKCEAGASDKQVAAYASHFDRSDPNHDGKHTRAEYVDGGTFMNPRARAGIFGATDNNADGVATRAEYVLNRIITDEAKGIVQKTDADKNGKITRNEFVKGSPIKDKKLAGAVYDALDTNSDKVIAIPEYLRVWGGWARPNYKKQEAAIARRLAKLGKNKKPAGKPSGKPSGGPPSVDRVFKIMDSNKDGKITKAEFRGPAFVFTGADKNKDGVVTRKEMETFRANAAPKDKPKRKKRTPHVKIGQAATDFELPVLIERTDAKGQKVAVVTTDKIKLSSYFGKKIVCVFMSSYT
jgi:Ca2+-binding EF-hand superfamily protein